MSFLSQIGNQPLVLIGEGSRRSCYRLAHQNVCVKFYRAPAASQWQRLSVGLHILIARFLRTLNVNVKEWRYHQKLRTQLPPDLFGIFPEWVEPVYSDKHGWGILESLIQNADGTQAKGVHKEMLSVSDPALRLRIYRETEQLLSRLAEYGVRFYDLHNLLLQWTGDGAFRLRVADFEPCGRGLLAWTLRCPFLARWKMERRTVRYLARLRSALFTGDVSKGALTTAAEPVRLGSLPLHARSVCAGCTRKAGLA